VLTGEGAAVAVGPRNGLQRNSAVAGARQRPQRGIRLVLEIGFTRSQVSVRIFCI